MNRISALKLAFAAAFALASPAAAQEEIRLWPGKAPGTEDWKLPEVVRETPRGRQVTNVVDPTLTVYLPPRDKANGTAIIVAPGGGLRALSIDGGGTHVAKWLNARGFAAFVLKYRVRQQAAGPRPAGAMPPPPPRPGGAGGEEGGPPMLGSMAARPELVIRNGNANPVPDDAEMTRVLHAAVADGQQSLRLVRKNAAKWGVDPKKVGMMGFSAGGGVAVGTALAPAGDAYPDFVVTLFGPSLQDVDVPAHAAPLFMAVKQDHYNVTPGLLALFTKWREARKPAELHVYDMINGNIGMVKNGTPSDTWLDRVIDWLAVRGFAPKVAYENIR